jgi:hypothetical protein
MSLPLSFDSGGTVHDELSRANGGFLTRPNYEMAGEDFSAATEFDSDAYGSQL